MAPKLRAVVDTNLIVSGIFGKDSLSARLMDLWITQKFDLATSTEILQEIGRVLQYPRIRERFGTNEETVRRFFRLVFRKGIVTKGLYQIDRITDDPSDNMFLACALESEADFIVSRDPHLRNLKQYHGVKIVDVKTFLEAVGKD